jgi:hypothetical protein
MKLLSALAVGVEAYRVDVSKIGTWSGIRYSLLYVSLYVCKLFSALAVGVEAYKVDVSKIGTWIFILDLDRLPVCVCVCVCVYVYKAYRLMCLR